uniref:Uncharacterized protein n=1 Tax=Paramoeba aparasomata TaxID=2583407 RepID=A0A5P8HBI5_9EUKA|nr:hypothetical protein [Paramoeba aparasomata]
MKNIGKFERYINKTIMGKITKYSFKSNILIGDTLSINYFYWWYKEIYNFKTVGICVKTKKKFHLNVESYKLFFIIKNIRVNQVYLSTSPFLTCLKKKRKIKRKKLIKTLYIL